MPSPRPGRRRESHDAVGVAVEVVDDDVVSNSNSNGSGFYDDSFGNTTLFAVPPPTPSATPSAPPPATTSAPPPATTSTTISVPPPGNFDSFDDDPFGNTFGTATANNFGDYTSGNTFHGNDFGCSALCYAVGNSFNAGGVFSTAFSGNAFGTTFKGNAFGTAFNGDAAPQGYAPC